MAIKHVYCVIILYLNGVQGNPEDATVPFSPEQSTTSEETEQKVNYVSPITILEYKPMTSFYHPEPVTLGVLISPGTPWPNSPDGYQKTTSTETPTLENKFGAETTVDVSTVTTSLFTENSKKTTTTTASEMSSIENKHEASGNGKPNSNPKPIIVLEYKPTRPSFVPEPSTINQIIPPGKPWPASPEEYTTLSPQLIDRFPELTSEKTTKTSTAAVVTKATTSNNNNFQTRSTHIVLEYKPQRPGYVPDPVTVGQIIPPGKPWPASPEGYAHFSVLYQKQYDASRDTNVNSSDVNKVSR